MLNVVTNNFIKCEEAICSCFKDQVLTLATQGWKVGCGFLIHKTFLELHSKAASAHSPQQLSLFCFEASEMFCGQWNFPQLFQDE